MITSLNPRHSLDPETLFPGSHFLGMIGGLRPEDRKSSSKAGVKIVVCHKRPKTLPQISSRFALGPNCEWC